MKKAALKHPRRVTQSQAVVLRWLAQRGACSGQCLRRYALISMRALDRRGLVEYLTRGDHGDFRVTARGQAWLAAHPDPLYPVMPHD